MNSEIILAKVKAYLAKQENQKKIEFGQLTKFSEQISSSLNRQLSQRQDDRGFRLRLSNLGRPACVLQSENLNRPSEPLSYASRFRNLYGDLVEAAAIAILYEAGVNVVSSHEGVSLDFGGVVIDGTYDVLIAEPDVAVYDIKSASGFAFRNKYLGKTLQNLFDDGDFFGYVTQLYGYSQAKGVPVGGLIVINKENGEWTIVPPPYNDKGLRLKALSKAQENISKIVNKEPFEKSFSDFEETFRKKKTGNRILPFECASCRYKASCWPKAELKKSLASEGDSPKKYWYTYIDEKYREKSDQSEIKEE